MKPNKNSIAFVIYNQDKTAFLVVQRPSDDESLPDVWGLPAGSLKEDETFEDCVVRSGKEKLGVDLQVTDLIGQGQIERENYILHMKEYEAKIINGAPEVPQQTEGITQYKRWKWGTAEDLKEAASKGSLCSQIYLKSVGESR